jgi:hypothetical protein
MTTTYGPGDAQTWPVCTGHPMDPRADDFEPSDEIDERVHALEEAESCLRMARAELALAQPVLGRVDRLLADAADALCPGD